MYTASKRSLILGTIGVGLLAGLIVLFVYWSHYSPREVYVYADRDWVASTVESANRPAI